MNVHDYVDDRKLHVKATPIKPRSPMACLYIALDGEYGYRTIDLHFASALSVRQFAAAIDRAAIALSSAKFEVIERSGNIFVRRTDGKLACFGGSLTAAHDAIGMLNSGQADDFLIWESPDVALRVPEEAPTVELPQENHEHAAS